MTYRKYLFFYFFIVSVLIFLMPLHDVCGKIYIWTDANGIKQFSNIAPPHCKNLKIRSLDEITAPYAFHKNSEPDKLPASIKKYSKFKVIKVYDGDTIKVTGYNNLIMVVRFAGIDAPETKKRNQPGQPYGEKAANMVKSLISGKQVFLKTYGTGGYNRILAEVFTKTGLNVNLVLVRNGLAEVYRGRTPYGFNISPYLKAQASAKDERRGIWSLGSEYESPRQWRRKHPWK